MSKLQNNFTTTEQSKRLLELGVPVDSADCYYVSYKDPEDYEISIRTKGDTGNAFFKVVSYTPCWSVGRLIEIMEICTKVKYNHNTTLPLLEDVISKLEGWRNSELIDFSKLEE